MEKCTLLSTVQPKSRLLKMFIFFSSVKVNRDILEAYTRDDKDVSKITSAIVLVNHQKVCILSPGF